MTLDDALEIALAQDGWYGLFRIPGGVRRVPITGWGDRKTDADGLTVAYVDWVMARFCPDRTAGNPRCYVINQMFGAHGHRFIYDSETPSALLAEGRVRRHGPLTSR